MTLDKEIESEGRLVDEDLAMERFSDLEPASATDVAARLLQSSVSETYDEYTGEALPAHLVAAASDEEVSMMEEWQGGIWDVVPKSEAFAQTGNPPLKGGG